MPFMHHLREFANADSNGDGVIDEQEFDKHMELMKVENKTSYLHMFIFLAFLFFLSMARIPAITEACEFMIGFSIVLLLCVLVLSKKTLICVSRVMAVV